MFQKMKSRQIDRKESLWRKGLAGLLSLALLASLAVFAPVQETSAEPEGDGSGIFVNAKNEDQFEDALYDFFLPDGDNYRYDTLYLRITDNFTLNAKIRTWLLKGEPSEDIPHKNLYIVSAKEGGATITATINAQFLFDRPNTKVSFAYAPDTPEKQYPLTFVSSAKVRPDDKCFMQAVFSDTLRVDVCGAKDAPLTFKDFRSFGEGFEGGHNAGLFYFEFRSGTTKQDFRMDHVKVQDCQLGALAWLMNWQKSSTIPFTFKNMSIENCTFSTASIFSKAIDVHLGGKGAPFVAEGNTLKERQYSSNALFYASHFPDINVGKYILEEASIKNNTVTSKERKDPGCLISCHGFEATNSSFEGNTVETEFVLSRGTWHIRLLGTDGKRTVFKNNKIVSSRYSGIAAVNASPTQQSTARELELQHVTFENNVGGTSVFSFGGGKGTLNDVELLNNQNLVGTASLSADTITAKNIKINNNTTKDPEGYAALSLRYRTSLDLDTLEAKNNRGARAAGLKVHQQEDPYEYTKIKNCTFEGNISTSANGGGAFYLETTYINPWNPGSFVLENMKFNNNMAAGNGGAMYMDLYPVAEAALDRRSIELKTCTFLGNRSQSGRGAAIYVKALPAKKNFNAVIKLNDVFIRGNESGAGSAVYAPISPILLSGEVAIEGNTTTSTERPYALNLYVPETKERDGSLLDDPYILYDDNYEPTTNSTVGLHTEKSQSSASTGLLKEVVVTSAEPRESNYHLEINPFVSDSPAYTHTQQNHSRYGYNEIYLTNEPTLEYRWYYDTPAVVYEKVSLPRIKINPEEQKFLVPPMIGPPNEPDGWEFIGWFKVKDDGTLEELTPNEFYPLTEDTVIYGRWKKLSDITVKYKFIGNKPTDVKEPADAKVDAETEVPLPTFPTKDGKFFEGWYLDEDGTDKVPDHYTTGKDVTLYGKWRAAVQYMITFGGRTTNSSDDASMTDPASIPAYEGQVVDLPVPAVSGGFFWGWYADPDGSDSVPQKYVVTKDVTLYAYLGSLKKRDFYTLEMVNMDGNPYDPGFIKLNKLDPTQTGDTPKLISKDTKYLPLLPMDTGWAGFVVEGWYTKNVADELFKVNADSTPFGLSQKFNVYYHIVKAEGKVLTVSFDYATGSSKPGSPFTLPADLKVSWEDEFELPIPKVPEGYSFDGWFKKKDGTGIAAGKQKFDLEKAKEEYNPYTATIDGKQTTNTFYAKITKKGGSGGNTPQPPVEKIQIKLENLSGTPSISKNPLPTAIEIKKGDVFIAPSYEAGGYMVVAWYTQDKEEETVKYSDTKLDKNTTLYAKWEKKPKKPDDGGTTPGGGGTTPGGGGTIPGYNPGDDGGYWPPYTEDPVTGEDQKKPDDKKDKVPNTGAAAGIPALILFLVSLAGTSALLYKPLLQK